MHFKHFSFLVCASTLFANDLSEEFISKLKREQFRIDFAKAKEEAKIEKDSWIEPLNLSYSNSFYNKQSRDQSTHTVAISADQPVFKSGGIFYAIKYAQINARYNHLSIVDAKRALIQDAISLLIDIKKSALQIQRQALTLANAGIDLERKEEQYRSGQIDSSSLNDAIIEKNRQHTVLLELKNTRQDLITQFQTISELDFNVAKAPTFTLLSKKEFQEKHLDIALQREDIERQRYTYKLRKTTYLPTLSVTGSYNYEEYDLEGSNSSDYDTHYYKVGLSFSMPLADINTFRSIESARLDYLKARVSLQDAKNSIQASYKKVVEKLAFFEEMIKLTKEDQRLYQSLLVDTKEQFSAGYKTEYDVQTLQNSYDIQAFNLAILEYDRQQELLALYEKVYK